MVGELRGRDLLGSAETELDSVRRLDRSKGGWREASATAEQRDALVCIASKRGGKADGDLRRADKVAESGRAEGRVFVDLDRHCKAKPMKTGTPR